jgi:hypothetical protein
MATFQSQINILVASLAQLYDEIEKPGPGGSCSCSNPFSLVKLNYENSKNVSNGTFQALSTYVLAMDIKNDFPCAQYDVSLGIYESTVDGHTFEYVVPEKYTSVTTTNGLDSFRNEFIHGTFDTTFDGSESLKILLNFPQLISLNDSLTINEKYVKNGTTTNLYNELIPSTTGESITFKKRSSSTEQRSETIKKLRNMQTQIESQPEETCVDLVNENFESIIYNNVYQLTENGNLTLKEHTNHPLKKHLTLSQSDYIYILECDTNLKYHIE